MKIKSSGLSIILIIGITVFLPHVFAEPTVSITMEKTTYSYCEKLFYTIEVSEITGELAIIHIRDEAGKGSSAIPMEISQLQTPIPSLVPFEAEIFPLGKYFIDVSYSGSEHTAEFNLIDSDKICIPGLIKQFLIGWINDEIPAGYLMDAFQKNIDAELIDIPFEINEGNIHEIYIPHWAKNIGYWWIEGEISDEEFGQAFNYLIEKDIITNSIQMKNEI